MGSKMDKILAEISAGELFDKITILEIKKSKISNKEKLNDIEKELLSLKEAVNKYIPNQSSISKYINDLKNINLKLWDIEDGKRAAEKNNKFDEKFTFKNQTNKFELEQYKRSLEDELIDKIFEKFISLLD